MSKDHLEMALRSIEAFQNNGQIDAEELNEIIAIAERDGVIDQNEIRVLRSIVSRIDPSEVDDEVRLALNSLSEKISTAGNS